MTPRNLVEELGRRLGIQLALDSSGLARIVVDGNLPVDFELDEANGRLLVYAVLGLPPSGAARSRFFEDVLAANLFGAELGHCAPAFDRERNEVLFWFAIAEDGNLDDATTRLEQLVGYVEQWRDKLADAQTAAPAEPAADGAASSTFGQFMRA